MRIAIPILVLTLVLATRVRAAVLLVPETYPTIQGGLNAAHSGDEVSVAPGEYHEHISFVSNGVTLKSRTTHLATIDGSGSGNVVVCNNVTATVDGFVITGGGTGYHAGVFTSQASQVIRNNIIAGNGEHGIALSSGSVATIENNTITDNGAWGAGIDAMTSASPVIRGNYIARNRYGVHISGGNAVVIVNNTIVNHKWNLYLGSTHAIVENNILATAETGILFGGPYSGSITPFVGQYLAITYNDVWQNSQYDYYAELGGIPYYNSGPFIPLPGTGEISANPLLGGAGDYHLLLTSPCINAGDPAFVADPNETDLDGNPRVLFGIVDVGAYEAPEFADCNSNGVPDGRDILLGTSQDANSNGVPDECERACPGDTNCDGRVTFADIDPFVEALAGESAWNQNHPGCPWLNADCNGSGTVTFADIDPFVARLGTTCH